MRGLEVDNVAVDGSRWCAACQRAKPLHCFYPGVRSCIACKQRQTGQWSQTRKGRAYIKEYVRRPDRKMITAAKTREYNKTPEGRARRKAYEQSLIGRLVHQRCSVRRRLKLAKPARREYLSDIEARLTMRLNRLRAQRDQDRRLDQQEGR